MRRKVIIATILLFIIFAIIMVSLYISEKNFRDWFDVHILRKDLSERDLPVISLNTGMNNQVYVYSKYIALLNNKILTIYNSFGEEVNKMDVDINTAVFDANKKYLAVAEDGGNSIYLLLDKTYLWSSTVEGEILQVHVNENGYVVVITSDSTHKSIVNLFNSSGKKLFISYFASTRIIDASISKDNKYIAVGELDTSGTDIESNIKIISIENAQNDPENAIINTYSSDNGKLIVSVKYQDNGKIACMYDKSIEIIEDLNQKEIKELKNIEDRSYTFMGVNLNNHIIYVQEESAGLFNSDTNVNVVNTSSNEEKTIVLQDVAKEIQANDNLIVINCGTRIFFYDTNGWLVKKYTASKEVTNVEFSNDVAAVIYKDKIIVIGF